MMFDIAVRLPLLHKISFLKLYVFSVPQFQKSFLWFNNRGGNCEKENFSFLFEPAVRAE